MSQTVVVVVCVVVLVGIVGVSLFLRAHNERHYDLSEIKLQPAISLRENPPETIAVELSDSEKLLEDFLPLVREKAASVATESSPEIVIEKTDRDILLEKIAKWNYRSFMQVGDQKSGTFENDETSQSLQVTEGYEFDGVEFVRLTENMAVVALGSASETLSLVLKQEPPPVEEKATSGPPSKEERDERRRRYQEQIMPTFQHIAARYTPLPWVTIRTTPPSPEEVQTAVAAYYETMRPTIEASTKIPGHPPSDEPLSEEEESRRAEWVATQIAVMRERHAEPQDGSSGESDNRRRGRPVPAPNQTPQEMLEPTDDLQD
ncbi:MAG TPA: hypothetical protein PKH07_04215 [bacterium]|nr:hypothetical protein [bacterium]